MRLTRFALLALVVGLFMFTSPPVQAGPQGCTSFPELNSFAFEQLAVSSTAVALTSTVYAPAGQNQADMAVVSVETNPVRHRDDGVPPTAAVGQPDPVSVPLLVCGQFQIQNIRFIRQVSDSTIDVTYYRRPQ